MKKMEAKSMNRPDEVRSFDKGKVELVKIGVLRADGVSSSLDGSGLNLSNPWKHEEL